MMRLARPATWLAALGILPLLFLAGFGLLVYSLYGHADTETARPD